MTALRELISVADAEKPYFFGIDVGGTNIKIGLVDDQGRTLAFESIETRETQGPQQAVERAATTCRDLAGSLGIPLSDIPQVGLGVPGSMCLKKGILVEPPNLPHWYGFAIKRALEEAIELPVSFINDANAAAYGESWMGAGAEHDSLAMFTLGTGVGGGLITQGTLINGSNSFGSECGHIIVDSSPDARLCVWGGGKGHLEAYSSASAVAARAEEAIAAGANSSLRQRRDEGQTVTAKLIHDEAVLGDPLSLELIDETAFYLGVGVASAVHAIDPGLVVLGGAMNFGGPNCPIGRRFLQGVIDEFQQRTFPNVFEGTTIDFATLGGDAGYIGSAGIARRDQASRSLT